MSADITYPVRADRGAVYDMILDADGRLVTFSAMTQKSQEITQLIVDLLNKHQSEVSA